MPFPGVFVDWALAIPGGMGASVVRTLEGRLAPLRLVALAALSAAGLSAAARLLMVPEVPALLTGSGHGHPRVHGDFLVAAVDV